MKKITPLLNAIPLELTAVLATLDAKNELPEPGDLLDLGITVEDPICLYVNGQLIAKGKVVIADDHFALEITELASAEALSHPEAA